MWHLSDSFKCWHPFHPPFHLIKPPPRNRGANDSGNAGPPSTATSPPSRHGRRYGPVYRGNTLAVDAPGRAGDSRCPSGISAIGLGGCSVRVGFVVTCCTQGIICPSSRGSYDHGGDENGFEHLLIDVLVVLLSVGIKLGVCYGNRTKLERSVSFHTLLRGRMRTIVTNVGEVALDVMHSSTNIYYYTPFPLPWLLHALEP